MFAELLSGAQNAKKCCKAIIIKVMMIVFMMIMGKGVWVS